jgi:hypothetical protein
MIKNNVSYRVEQLEKCQVKIEERLDSLLENHIPHLQLEMEALKTRANVLTLVNVGAIVLAILINRFL